MNRRTLCTPRVVLITGGARGIGFGIASCFAKQNATLVIADVQEDLAHESCVTLKEIGAADALGIACDITQRAQVETTVAAALEKFGRIDVLINNAGISPFVNVMELSPETFHKVLDVNLTGGFYCTEFLLSILLSAQNTVTKAGALFSSVASRRIFLSQRKWSTP